MAIRILSKIDNWHIFRQTLFTFQFLKHSHNHFTKNYSLCQLYSRKFCYHFLANIFNVFPQKTWNFNYTKLFLFLFIDFDSLQTGCRRSSKDTDTTINHTIIGIAEKRFFSLMVFFHLRISCGSNIWPQKTSRNWKIGPITSRARGF